MDDIAAMKLALLEAQAAAEEGEIPVGAVICRGNEILARAHNTREGDLDIAGHAEIKALQEAAKASGSWALEGCTLYVTLEPCPMCAGAILQSRISSLCFGAKDEREGAIVSKYHYFDDAKNAPLVRFGTLAEECSSLLKTFFEAKR